MWKRILLIFTVFSFAYGQDRKISSKLNPGLDKYSSNTVLVYIKCDGKADTIHQIWDFTKHTPTIIFAISNLNSTLNITWEKMEPKEFIFSEEPKYSFAIAIDKIVEYDDLDDNGHVDARFPQRDVRFDGILWSLVESQLNDDEVMIEISGKIRRGHHRNDTVRLKLDLLPFKDYAVDLPHLIHTANSTLINLELVNLTISPEYNSSRYAVHLTLVSTDDITSTMHYNMRKSLDDEHTPGVFEIIEIKTPALYDNNEGGYLQFRPVGYTEPERSVGSSTVAHVSNFNRSFLPGHSTLQIFYQAIGAGPILVQDMFVSFGERGDGFYRNHNYTDWSFTMGYGSPPVEGFSLFVILVISIGLGVPVLLAISGVIVVLRRPRNRERLH